MAHNPYNHDHPYDPQKHNPRYALLASFFAIGSVGFLILIKAYAYYMSNSAAVLGTLTDSVVDIAVSFMMLYAVSLSLKPADAQHRFGHGKVEGIAALLQGAFMGGAGIFLGFEAFDRFIHPTSPTHHQLGIAVAVLAICFSIMVMAVQKFSLKRAPSLAIEADHAHYKTDVLLNGSVIIALLANYYGGTAWLDPAFALLIAGYFMRTAFQVINQSVDMLMDKELSDSVRTIIEEIVADFKDVHGMHDLRTRMSGMNMHISFDVELEPDISLQAAHDIVRALDHALLTIYPNAEILIHMDPIGDTEDPRHVVDGVHH